VRPFYAPGTRSPLRHRSEAFHSAASSCPLTLAITHRFSRRGFFSGTIDMYNSDGEMEQLAEDLKATLELCDDSPHFVVSISRQTATRGFSGIQVVFKGSLPDKDRSRQSSAP
jgi:hypothetical protein